MLFKAYNQIIRSDFDLQLPHGEGDVDINILQREIETPLYVKTDIYRKGVRAEIAVLDNSLGMYWEGIGKFQCENGTHLFYSKIVDSDGVFRLFTLSEPLGLLLFQKGFFLLHGSAIVIGGKVTIFIGPPGAGKSTMAAAFARRGNTILSDDLLAITFDKNGRPYVVPGFPQLKIWASAAEGLGYDADKLPAAFEGQNKYLVNQDFLKYTHDPIPLEEIFVIKEPDFLGNNEMADNKKLIELTSNFPLPPQILKGQYLINHFQDSLRIVESVKMHFLPRPKDFRNLLYFVDERNHRHMAIT